MAFDNIYVKDATSVIIQVMMRDSLTGMGKTGVLYSAVTGSYCRPGGIRQPVTVIAGTVGDAYDSGKWAEVDAVNMAGLYQFHVPNAALATGANSVEFAFKATGVLDKSTKIILLDSNLRDSVRLGLTALPNAVAGAVGGVAIVGSEMDISAAASVELRDTLWNATMQYVDKTGAIKGTKAWIMLQALFSTIEQRLKEME